MGCDIHLVLEGRDSPTDKWHFVHDYPYMEGGALRILNVSSQDAIPHDAYIGWHVKARNYEFFAALAGVRGDGPAAKGLPCGMAPETSSRVESWGSDGHSHTHYDIAEFAEIYGRLDHVRAAFVADKLAGRHALSSDGYGEWLLTRAGRGDYQEHRVIIWFDN